MKKGEILMWPVYFTKKKSWRAFVLPLLLILAMACLLVGCSEKPQPLSGIYIGHMHGDRNDGYIVLFSRQHPKEVGLVKNFDGASAVDVFPVTYKKDFFTLHSPTGADDTFTISKDRKTLTCLSCRGVDTPRIYHYQANFGGKPSTEQRVDKYFEAVVKHVRKQDSNQSAGNLLGE